MTIPTPSPMWGDVTVTRTAAGSYSSGRWVDGAQTDFTARCSVQPATPYQLTRLPEGLRTMAAVAFWSTSELKTANETDGTPADLITWEGTTWEVRQVEHWGHHAPDMEHWRGIATRVTP